MTDRVAVAHAELKGSGSRRQWPLEFMRDLLYITTIHAKRAWKRVEKAICFGNDPDVSGIC